jgi:hypothetical protein
MENPRLIELSTKNYLFHTLHSCHSTRLNVYYYVLNIGIFILFIGIGGLVLYNCNKQKLSEYDKNQKVLRDQKYVLSKIRYYQDENKQSAAQMSGITNLPITT